MKEKVLLDTGPMVALVSARDSNHEDCVAQLKGIHPPLITTWSVLTEAAWLLRAEPNGFEEILQGCQTGLFFLSNLEDTALPWIAGFLARYQKLHCQLADASLVYLAERDRIDTIFTLDRRDFSVYRFGRNRSFRLLP